LEGRKVEVWHLRALLERSLPVPVRARDGSYSAPLGVDGPGKRMTPMRRGVATAFFAGTSEDGLSHMQLAGPAAWGCSSPAAVGSPVEPTIRPKRERVVSEAKGISPEKGVPILASSDGELFVFSLFASSVLPGVLGVTRDRRALSRDAAPRRISAATLRLCATGDLALRSPLSPLVFTILRLVCGSSFCSAAKAKVPFALAEDIVM